MPKWILYSITDKLAVIASIKWSESLAQVFQDNGVPESTIHGWLKDEEKLHDFVDTVDFCDEMKRKKANEPYLIMYFNEK